MDPIDPKELEPSASVTKELHPQEPLQKRIWAKKLWLVGGVLGTILLVLLLQEVLIHVVEIMVRLLVRSVVWISKSIFRFF